jgi:serine/threonine protein kinase
MSSDFTEHQSDDELSKARKLSIEPTRPPAKIEGYSIQNFVGRGSYGEVWSAIDQKTGKRVAIKFYAQRSSVDVKQLAQEVEKLVVLAADRHVVQLLDVGWDASPPYYVMDYIEFGSLEDRIKSGEPMQVSRAVEVFKEVATGLMHLHGKGVLHCDLKPGNVLLDQDGKPRLADFGQSRLKTDNTSALGTLFYMAPEQADLRSAPDARWDVYGLGALLYTMLIGKPPYYSDELKQKIENAETLHDRLKTYRRSLNNSSRLREHRNIPGVDRSLADIIDRCIAPRPTDRFASAQSVLSALQQRDMKHQNRPLMLLGILGPVLLLVVMSLFGWWALRQATSDADQAVITNAEDKNQFVAAMAARSAAEQLDEYFRVVKQISQDEDFLDAFDSMLNDEDLRSIRQQLSDPNDNGKESTKELRQALVDHPARQDMQPIFQRLMDDPQDEYPEVASWFATDRAGNQVAGVFDSGNSETIGKNYSYRTYFTGFAKDVTDSDGEKKYPVVAIPSSRPIIENPHLSASFFSQASGLLKVAFSVPLRDKDDTIIGIVAATVNLGKLGDFQNEDNHYVVLVDTRKDEGDPEAGDKILEHPLFLKAKQDNKNKGIPKELTDITIDMEKILSEHTSADPFGKTSMGALYDRMFIVAREEVMKDSIKNSAKESTESTMLSGQGGIHVLAFEDYESVLKPSRELSARLGRLALLALLILLSLAIGMWLLVNRIFRESRKRLVGSPDSGTSTTFTASSISTASSSEPGSTTRG